MLTFKLSVFGRSDMGENVPGGPHADTRSRRLSGKYLDPPSPAADGKYIS